MAGGPNPSVANVGNILTAQSILFDKELIPNLKGETDAFVVAAERRVQPNNTGINRQFFQYNTLTGDIAQVGDGVVCSPEFVGQFSAPAQLGEWNNCTNFSASVIASALYGLGGNST